MVKSPTGTYSGIFFHMHTVRSALNKDMYIFYIVKNGNRSLVLVFSDRLVLRKVKLPVQTPINHFCGIEEKVFKKVLNVMYLLKKTAWC